MRAVSLAAVLVAALALAGCAFDYGKEAAVSADSIPVMSFQGLKQIGVKDGRKLYTMQSDAADVYSAKKQTRLKNFQFEEYDSDGKTASHGRADEAVINTSTNDAEIHGQLEGHDAARGVTLTTGAGGLTWTNDDRILKTNTGTPVKLTKDDGSEIDGEGLVLDLGANRIELQAGIQGTWTPENKDDKTAPATDTPHPSPTPHP
jgi:LPS export ABC transporter protein LptC